MKNSSFEKKIAEYFEKQANEFKLPNENEIKAFQDQFLSYKKAKRNLSVRSLPAIAACIALVSIIISAVFVYNRPASVDLPHEEQSMFGEVGFVDGVAEWYEPGTLDVEFRELIANDNPSLAAFSIKQMSKRISAVNASYEKDNLPSWVFSVQMINEKYALLNTENLPEGYQAGYMIYDLETKEVFSLVERIYNLDKEYFDSIDTVQMPIGGQIYPESISNMGLEWCIIRVWNTVNGHRQEQYMFNFHTGEKKLLPLRAVITISSDYKYIVFSNTNYGNEEPKADIKNFSVLNTDTMQLTEICRSEYGEYLSDAVFFSEDDRYIVFYLLNGEHGGWDTYNAKWKIYDTQTGNIQQGNGEIIRYTDDGNALIVRDNNGAKVYDLNDMSDITDSYDLAVYEHYELIKELKSGNFTLYLDPMFGVGERVMLAENVDEYLVWGDYVYYCQRGINELCVYSIRENEMFTIAYTGEAESNNSALIRSIYITDNGKKCNICITNKDSYQY